MNREECYGNLFPTITSPKTGVQLRGKVFTAELRRAGGLAIVGHAIGVDESAWNECVACDAFDHCYKLSMAKLALETGVMQNSW